MMDTTGKKILSKTSNLRDIVNKKNRVCLNLILMTDGDLVRLKIYVLVLKVK